jgi:hypothetical protein
MPKTIQEISQETLKLENIFASATAGEFFAYNQLQMLTEITMDNKGKAYMRSALCRLKLPYECERGNGIKVLSPQNATRIIVSRVVKIDNSIKRAEKTTTQVKNRVYDELTEPEQKNILFLSALFGTIRSYSSNAKRIFAAPSLTVGSKVS